MHLAKYVSQFDNRLSFSPSSLRFDAGQKVPNLHLIRSWNRHHISSSRNARQRVSECIVASAVAPFPPLCRRRHQKASFARDLPRFFGTQQTHSRHSNETRIFTISPRPLPPSLAVLLLDQGYLVLGPGRGQEVVHRRKIAFVHRMSVRPSVATTGPWDSKMLIDFSSSSRKRAH